MPSAALLGISGWRHKRSWRVRVKVPTVAILGFSMFSFLFLVWGPMQLDCKGRQGASSGDGRKEVQVGPWGLASGALDARVVMEMLETQSTSISSGFETGRRKVLAVVGLHTGFDALQRRKSLRETWVPATPEGSARQQEATGVVVKFVIGWTSDAVKMATVEEEAEVFKDFILLDTEESAQMRMVKPLAYFKAAYKLFDADFYVKADDNIYLRPDRLSTLLAKDRSSPRTYLGCMKNGIVVQDPKHKWYEPLSGLLGKEYFHHAYGAIYALSAEVVATLAAARDGSLRMFSNDDVTIGAWMLAMNVEYEDNRALCDSECHDNSVAVWDIPKCSGLCDATVQLPELHNRDICSNSPTLPDS